MSQTQTPEQVLKQFFGYDSFRHGQNTVISALIKGRDALCVMPTGAGKSLCYQIPALISDGITLVISPLISLMRDQVQALVANGVGAAYINSSLTAAQIGQAMRNAREGRYKIIYIAPERLLAPSVLDLAQTLSLSLIAVDEAHCISQWGQDFRPSYLTIPQFVSSLPVRPTLAAATATATPRVRRDILKTLELKNPLVITTGFDRPNLYFEVKRPGDKYAELIRFLQSHDGGGIVYCSTRKETDAVTARLLADGYKAARYHAGLSDEERARAQDDFLYDRVRIIAATCAFGMGIDKSDARFVVHYNMPQNIESYYQEAGRAGRDGLPADCALFYARKDINTALYLINQSENEEEKRRNRKLLDQMERYCETDDCLRRFILQYFGEGVADTCGNCGNCAGGFAETDATTEAQKLLSCIARINKQHRPLGFGAICKVARGKADEYTQSRGLDKIPTFGALCDFNDKYIRRLFDKLVFLDYIALSDDNYRVAELTPKARDILFGGARIALRLDKQNNEQSRAPGGRIPAKYAFSEDLFKQLKELRLEIANENKIPAFIVFSDATLVDMCTKHPRTEEELLQISGVGEVKSQRYGARFLELLKTVKPSGEQSGQTPLLTPKILREQAEITCEPVQITRVADIINAIILRFGQQATTGAALNKALIEHGYIEEVNGVKLPTEKGRGAGITTIERRGDKGSFTQCLFGEEAQRVILEILSVF